MRSVARKHWPKIASRLKEIYHAASAEQAAQLLDGLEDDWGQQYPALIGTWRRSWDVFTPFLGFTDTDPQTDLHLEHGRVAQRQVPVSDPAAWPFP